VRLSLLLITTDKANAGTWRSSRNWNIKRLTAN